MPGIGASGILGLAVEAVSGTYLAPTKFIPFNSESLMSVQDTIWRRPIRQSADVIGAVPGNFHVEGDVEMEALEDVVLYFLAASRTTIVKSGTTPNWIYTITPNSSGVPTKTLSLTVVRNGIVFGFTGMMTSSFSFSIEDGLLKFSASMLGRDEQTQTAPTPTWPTSTPFGAGMYSVEIPTATPVTDTDAFEFTNEDNAEAQFRLKSTGRGAQFVKYGERNTTLHFERDFDTRTDFDAFKAITAQSITVTASKGANNSISILIPAAVKNSYEIANSSQGDIVRASIGYMNTIDATGKSWQIIINSQEVYTP